MVEEACEGLAGVAASQVEMQSGIQFYDGITTGRNSGNSDSFCLRFN
jgi:ribonucleoside-diphosphate reductase alpha chain